MADGACGWWILPGSNRQPCGYEPRALPVELRIRMAAGLRHSSRRASWNLGEADLNGLLIGREDKTYRST